MSTRRRPHTPRALPKRITSLAQGLQAPRLAAALRDNLAAGDRDTSRR